MNCQASVMCRVLLATVVVGAQGCTSQQLYGSGQLWQKQECNKIIESQQRARCMQSAARSYDDYQREAAAAARGAK